MGDYAKGRSLYSRQKCIIKSRPHHQSRGIGEICINFRKLKEIIGINIDFSSYCHPAMGKNFDEDTVVHMSPKEKDKIILGCILPLFNNVLGESSFMQQIFIEIGRAHV